jgi:hypothetical protein
MTWGEAAWGEEIWGSGPLAVIVQEVGGGLTPTGDTDQPTTFLQWLNGELAPFGTTTTPTGFIQAVGASLTPEGVTTQGVGRVVEMDGTLTPSGSISRITAVELGATLSLSGTTAKLVSKAIGGTITPEGVLDTGEGLATLFPTSVLRFRLEHKKWLNRLAFEMSTVPVNWRILYHHAQLDTMVELTDSAGQPVGGTMMPPEQAFGAQSRNWDWNYYLSQYRRLEFILPLIETNIIEFHIDRNVRWGFFDARLVAALPAYSVAVRNVDLALYTTDYDDLPPMFEEDVIVRGPLGHVERLTLDDWNATKAIDGELTTYWQSAPQASGDAIVPFYLDVRDPEGNAQLIDRLDLDPMFTGPSMNIYYSNDDTVPSDFRVSRSRRLLDVLGDVESLPGHGPNFNAAGQAYRLPDNDTMRMRMSRDWTVGVVYEPTYEGTAAETIFLGTASLGANRLGYGGSGAPPGKKCLWEIPTETERYALVFDPSVDQLQLLRDDAEVLAAVTIPLRSSNEAIVVVASYSTGTRGAPAGWYISTALRGSTDIENGFEADTEVLSGWPSAFYIGNNSSLTQFAYGYVRDVWIRQEPISEEVVRSFVLNTHDMMRNLGPADRPRGDYNAVFQSRLLVEPIANVGPDFNLYELKTWTPVYRDYKLRKGVMDLPPTKCKYLKLEFSRLVPRPYPTWEEGIERVVRDYPQWVHQWYATIEQHTRMSNLNTDSRVYRPGDSALTRGAQIYDPTQVLNRRGGQFDTQEYRQTEHKRFFRAIRHEYEMRTVRVDYQQAYFVGLHEVTPYRADYRVADDTPEYIETFGDDTILDLSAETYTVRVTGTPPIGSTFTLSVGDQTTGPIAWDATALDVQTALEALSNVDPGDAVVTGNIISPGLLITFGVGDFGQYDTVDDYDNLGIYDPVPRVSQYADVNPPNITGNGVGLLPGGILAVFSNAMERDPYTDRMRATATGQMIQTRALESFSNFQAVQVAAQASGYESQFSDAQLSLLTFDHITDLTDTTRRIVTDEITGEGAGNVLEFTPTPTDEADIRYDAEDSYDSAALRTTYDGFYKEYGTRTNLGTYQSGEDIGADTAAYDTSSSYDRYNMDGTRSDPNNTFDDTDEFNHASIIYDEGLEIITENVRVTAVARIYLTQGNAGTYVLRLYANEVLIASKAQKLPPRKWVEMELPYFTQATDINLQVEIVQIDSTTSEPFAVDLLGIFQNPLHWEVSNDGGQIWQSVRLALNNPDGWVTLPRPGNQLKVRCTAQRVGAHVQGFIVVPWYQESPMVSRIPIDYLAPPGMNEHDDLRDPSHKPFFRVWSRPWPQRFSLAQLGSVPTTGLGIRV